LPALPHQKEIDEMEFARIYEGEITSLGNDVIWFGHSIPPVVVLSMDEYRALHNHRVKLEAALTELELAATLSLSDVPGDIDYVRLSKACQAARAALDEA
jgi:hypothetical protein